MHFSRVLPLLAIPALLLWAVPRTLSPSAAPSAAAAADTRPAPYPNDWRERAARVGGLRLCWGTEEEIPADLQQQDGAGQPDIGSPRAVLGGRVRLSCPGPYPAHWLRFGSTQPQFFHDNAFRAVDIPLVMRHPQTGASLPGTAATWAVRGQQVFFFLREGVRYSNGRPLRAGDYLLGALLRAECGDGGAQRLAEEAEELRVYGDAALSLTLRHPSPSPEQSAAALLTAAEPAFYAAFGSDYRERYAQRIPPTTGGYRVGRCERGRLVVLERVRNWWGREQPYLRHSCNADAVEYHFLTDEAQAWEFLLRGRLDALQTRNLTAWHRRAEECEAAGLRRVQLRAAEYPLPPYGIALNARTLPDVQLRRGLLHALDMGRATELLFRGEAERAAKLFEGYGPLSAPEGEPPRYDPAAARAAFAAAGYTQAGSDGILRRPSGEPLRVRLLYTPNEKVSTLVQVLVAGARRCGAELVPDAQPWQSAAQQVQEGRHELLFWATCADTPLPRPRRLLHSSATGYDAPFGARDAALDALIEHYETAPDAEALTAIEQRVRELALWLPGWRENQVYLLHAPRLHLPSEQEGIFTAAAPYELGQAMLYWAEP